MSNNTTTPQKQQQQPASLVTGKNSGAPPSTTPSTPVDSSASSTISSPSGVQQQQAPERTPFLVLSAPVLNFNDAIQTQPSLQFAFDDINQDVIVQNGNSIDFVSRSGQKFTYKYAVKQIQRFFNSLFIYLFISFSLFHVFSFSAQFTIMQPRSSPARNYFSAVVSDRKMVRTHTTLHHCFVLYIITVN